MEEMNMENMPMTAQEISGELMEDAAGAQAQEMAQSEAAIREGIAELFEDGWTGEELRLLSEDEEVRAQIAAGKSLVRAAAMYLRRQMAAGRPAARRSLPVTRATAAGSMPRSGGIEQMTDAQFAAFSKQAREAAMMGRKIRM